MGRCVELAAEAARESRCRLVMGLGEGDTLNAAREAAGRTLLPCLLLPTSVGYGEPRGSQQRPLPEILIVDPRLAVGSAPGRTAAQGLELFAALLEPYAAGPPAEVQDLLPSALRLLVDSLPGAVNRPQNPSHRSGLAEATATAARVLGLVESRFPPMKELLRRLVPDGPVEEGVLAGMIPAVLAAGSEDKGPFPRSRVAQLGRQILGVREDDDGRAASWAAGGIRQWILNLGLQPTLTGAPAARAREDEQLRAVLAGALR
jgi:alcohol dehydrogenase class IV